MPDRAIGRIVGELHQHPLGAAEAAGAARRSAPPARGRPATSGPRRAASRPTRARASDDRAATDRRRPAAASATTAPRPPAHRRRRPRAAGLRRPRGQRLAPGPDAHVAGAHAAQRRRARVRGPRLGARADRFPGVARRRGGHRARWPQLRAPRRIQARHRLEIGALGDRAAERVKLRAPVRPADSPDVRPARRSAGRRGSSCASAVISSDAASAGARLRRVGGGPRGRHHRLRPAGSTGGRRAAVPSCHGGAPQSTSASAPIAIGTRRFTRGPRRRCGRAAARASPPARGSPPTASAPA